MPKFVSAATFGLSIPQTYMLYQIVWADPCSDAFFKTYELSLSWIATVNALDGAAACGLGYIDYKLVHENTPEMVMAMRKKRLAFAKFAFIMAIVALSLVDKPSPNSVAPLIAGSIYQSIKLGTQIGYNLTPEKFFMGRTVLSMYNLAILCAIWYKLRQAR